MYMWGRMRRCPPACPCPLAVPEPKPQARVCAYAQWERDRSLQLTSLSAEVERWASREQRRLQPIRYVAIACELFLRALILLQ